MKTEKEQPIGRSWRFTTMALSLTGAVLGLVTTFGAAHCVEAVFGGGEIDA